MLGEHENRKYTFMIAEIIKALHKNRSEHAKIVEEAQRNFRKMAIREMERMLKDAKSGKSIRTSLNLLVPQSYARSYDNAIEVLEATQRAGTEKIELTAREYEKFVQNRWDWSGAFNASNSTYSKRLSVNE